MIQFTAKEIEVFRSDERLDIILSSLREKTALFLSRPILVPETGIANWSHYFYCPNCSVKLIHDLDKPHDHECPICHRHFTDELKDGAWWRLTNLFNENGCMDSGKIWILTGDRTVARKAIDVMLSYSKYYPGYEVHGDIPYNGPGKINAQTLDEANFLRHLAFAYDLLEDAMTDDEKTTIKENIFRPGIEFLKDHRNNQVHNHEVICDGSIGVLALVLGDKKSLDFALNSKYGLMYQLEHGTLEDGFWFECSTAYHFYALENFLQYERFARHTEYSNLSNPLYSKMLHAVLKVQLEDLSFPLLNDSHVHQGKPDAYNLFEFAYSAWKDDEILQILTSLTDGKPRVDEEAFFYGVKELPECPEIAKKTTLKGETGLGTSVLRRGEDTLYFRHGPYGGEHDHYDRLGIGYYRSNKPVSIDIGTTGYGAPLHYAYYKKTNTHNTVVLNNGNQAPSCGRIVDFRETDEMLLCKAEVEWTDNYNMPDSFWILQWDDKSYRNVKMTRTIALTDYGIYDRFDVENAEASTVIDLNMHFHGEEILTPALEGSTVLGSEEPYCYFENPERIKNVEVAHSAYLNDEIVTDYFYALGESEGIRSRGYDNPSNNKMNYVTRRVVGSKASYVSFISSGQKDRVADVEFLEDGVVIHTAGEKEKTFDFSSR